MGDVPGDPLGAKLGVPGLNLVALNVDGGVEVPLEELLADDDGVLKVVPVKGHDGHEDVLPQGQEAVLGGGAVGEEVPFAHPLPHHHPGALVQGRTLVGAVEAAQGVLHQAAVLVAHDDAVAVHLGHLPVLLGVEGGQGVPHHPLLGPVITTGAWARMRARPGSACWSP